MNTNSPFLAVCLAVAAEFPVLCSAAIRAENIAKANETAAIQVSAGILSGEAKEHVFTYGDLATGKKDGRRHQLSRLDWDMKDVPVIGVNGSLRFGERFGIHAGVWGALDSSEDDGDVDDYDWMAGDGVSYSDYSQSTSDLTSGVIADANLSYDIVKGWNGVTASLFVGIRVEEWEWDAMGLYALYSELNHKPYFETGKFVEYRQSFTQGYLGLAAEWRSGALALNGYLTWGRYYAEDEDEHLGSYKHFEDTFEEFDADAFSCGISASYDITENMTMSLAYDFQYYGLSIGKIEVWDVITDAYEVGEDGAGISMRYGIASIAFSFAF